MSQITPQDIQTYLTQHGETATAIQHAERDYLGEKVVNIILSDHRKLVVPASVIVAIKVVQTVAQDIEQTADVVSDAAASLLSHLSPAPTSPASPKPKRGKTK